MHISGNCEHNGSGHQPIYSLDPNAPLNYFAPDQQAIRLALAFGTAMVKSYTILNVHNPPFGIGQAGSRGFDKLLVGEDLVRELSPPKLPYPSTMAQNNNNLLPSRQTTLSSDSVVPFPQATWALQHNPFLFIDFPKSASTRFVGQLLRVVIVLLNNLISSHILPGVQVCILVVLWQARNYRAAALTVTAKSTVMRKALKSCILLASFRSCWTSFSRSWRSCDQRLEL